MPKTNQKILMISSDNSLTSGAFLSMVTVCKLLKRDHAVAPLVVLPYRGKGTQLLDDAGIPYIRIRSYSWVVKLDQQKTIKTAVKTLLKKALNHLSIARIHHLLKRDGFDYVHINTTYSYVGAVAALKAGVPFVWHLRELLEEDQMKTLWNRSKGNALIGKANHVIAISTCVYEKYASFLSPKKLMLIFNGIETEKFHRPDKRVFQSKTLLFTYVGGFSEYKGTKDLISALRIVIDRGFSTFQIQLIGNVPPAFRDMIETNGLSSNVQYVGYQKDVVPFYEKSDIAFCCSRMEAFGRKTVEAMLAGALVIAANTGGSLDIVKHRQTGLLYQQGDDLSLAEMILYAAQHPGEMEQVANNGRAFAFSTFTASKNAAEIADVYANDMI